MAKKPSFERYFFQGTAILGLALSIMLNAFAADSTGFSNVQFDTNSFNANLNMSQAQSYVTQFTSCMPGQGQMDPLADALIDSLTKKPGSSAVGAGTCSDSIPVTRIDCPTKGAFDETIFNRDLTSAKKTLSCMKTKASQIQKVQTELKCLKDQASGLAQQVSNLQTAFQQNIQGYQSQLGGLDGVIKSRFDQMRFVQEKLGEDKDTGATGLMALQRELQKVFPQQITQEVAELVKANKQVQLQIEAFEMQKKNVRAGRMKECFQQADSGFRCSIGSTTNCSMQEYLLAHYYEKYCTVNGTNQCRLSKRKEQDAKAAANSVRTLFAQIFNQASSNTKFSATTQQEAQAMQAVDAGKRFRITSPKDIEAKFGSALSGKNLENFDVHGFVMNGLQQCYEQADAETKVESDPELKAGYEVIEQTRKDLTTNFTKFLKGYGDIYQRIYATFGQQATLNVDNCVSDATPYEGKLKCVTDLKTNMEGLVTGNRESANFTIAVPGVATPTSLGGGNTQFAFSCYGVGGCVTKMQNVIRELKAENQRLDAGKRSYISKANQAIDTFKKQMTDSLSVQSQALSARINSINAFLAQNGGGAINLTAMKGQPMRKGRALFLAGDGSLSQEGEGIYELPPNLLASIGAELNPPMLDPNSGAFEEGYNSLASALERRRELEREANRAVETMMIEAKRCREEIKVRIATNLEASASSFVSACSNDVQWCETKSDVLNSLISDLNSGALAGEKLEVVSGMLSNGRDNCGVAREEKSRAAIELRTSEANKASDCAGGNDPQSKQLCRLAEAKYEAAKAKFDSYSRRSGRAMNCDRMATGVRNKVSAAKTGGLGDDDEDSSEAY